MDLQGSRNFALGLLAQRLGEMPIRQFRRAGVPPQGLLPLQFTSQERRQFDGSREVSHSEQHGTVPAAGQPSSSAAHAQMPPPPPPSAGPWRIPKLPAPAAADDGLSAAGKTTAGKAAVGKTGTGKSGTPAIDQLRKAGFEIPDNPSDPDLAAKIFKADCETLRAWAARERRVLQGEDPWRGQMQDCKHWLGHGSCNFGLHCCNIHVPDKAGSDPSLRGGGGRGKGGRGGRGGGRDGRDRDGGDGDGRGRGGGDRSGNRKRRQN